MFASNNTNTNNRGSFGSRKKTNLPNKALDQLAEGGMAASNEDRIARFSTHKSENRYLEMKAKREELKKVYIRQGKMADPDHVYQLDEAVPFVAECMDMCPEYEREEREYTNFLEPFEKIPGTDRVDHSKAVKRYKRSAAGDPPPLPCDVRPPKVLFSTLDYLFHEIIGIHGVAASHSFVRDRARSIRNDLTLQSYSGIEAIILHERIARYHIMCSNFLCGSEGFVMQQEEEQLRKSIRFTSAPLLSLMEFYSEMSAKGIVMTNEAEFQSYYILTLPWSNDVPSRLEKELPPSVFFDPQVQLAMKIRFLMTRREEPNRPSVDGSLNHYSKIFSIIKKDSTSYLLSCCIHMHFRDIRKSAIRAIQKSYYYTEADPSSGLLLSEIIDSLGFDGEADALAFLNHYFIDVSDGLNGKVACVGRKVITDSNGKLKPGDYPKFPFTIIPDNMQLGKSELIESKRKGISYIDILDGKYVSLDVKTGVSPVVFASPMKRNAMSFSGTSSFPVPVPMKSSYNNPTSALKNANTYTILTGPMIQQPVISMNGFSTNGVSANVNPNGASFSFKPFMASTPEVSAPLFQLPHTASKSIPTKPIAPETIESNAQKKSTVQGDLRSLFSEPKKRNTEEIKLSSTQFVSASPSNINTKRHDLIPKPIAASSPQTIFDATAVLRTYKKELAISLFDSLYFDLVESEVKTILNSSLQKLTVFQNDLSMNFYESFLESIITDLVKDRLDTRKKLDNWRFALHQVLDNLANEVSDSMSFNISKQILDEKKLEYRRCIFVRDRWKFFILYLKYQRRKQELIGKKMVSYLRQSTFAPPIIDSFDPIVENMDADMKDKCGDMIESKLADLAREMQEKRATWYRRIRLEAQVLPFVNPARPLSSHYKFVLCTNGFDEKVTGSLGWFTDTWLQSKLSSHSQNSTFLGDPILNCKNEPALLLDERFTYDGDEEIRILLYHTDDYYLSAEAMQLHNADSKFSGCNAAIFQCDYFSNTKYRTRREYWDHLSESLEKFAYSMPKYANIPLLLIFWVSPGLLESHFAEKFASEISFLRTNAPFVNISVIYLNVSTDSFDSEEASSCLQKGMVWIFDNSTLPPAMNNHILSNCENLSKNYEWAIRKLGSLVSKQEVYLIPQLHSILGTSMAKLHNCFMKRITEILTDQACIQLAFPALEFIEDSRIRYWNTLESMKEIQEAEVAFRLPFFATSEWTTNNLAQVVNMYIRYADLLSSLPGMTAEDIDSLKSLILAPTFSSTHVWFSISNTVVRLISRLVDIEERFYIIDTLKENGSIFARECQGIVSQFMRDDTITALLERNIPSTNIIPKSSSLPDSRVETRKRKNEEEELNPLATLKKAMQKASLFLSERE